MDALIGIAVLVLIVVAYFKVSDWFGTAVAHGIDRADKATERRRAEQRAREASGASEQARGPLRRALHWIFKTLDEKT